MANHLTQNEAKQYVKGYIDGKHAAARSILEHISNQKKDIANGYKHDIVAEIEKRAIILKGGIDG